jgi:hypothetical protein
MFNLLSSNINANTNKHDDHLVKALVKALMISVIPFLISVNVFLLYLPLAIPYNTKIATMNPNKALAFEA